MKRLIVTILSIFMTLSLSACSSQNSDLVVMAYEIGDEYTTIVWDDNIYIPYGPISRSDCGQQIGFIDGNENDKIYEFRGYSTDEWIISALPKDPPMLWRETNVAEYQSPETSGTANNSSEADRSSNDYSVVIDNLTIALYENKQDITSKLDEAVLSYKEYDTYYMIDEALCVYFEDDICVRISFLNEVPQTARGIYKGDSYSQLIEQYGESFEKHTYSGKELYDVYRYSTNDYICEFGILPEISDAIYNIEIYTPDQYPIYDYGEELE